MSRNQNILVGLDVGTTKICAIIGELNEDGVVDIVGVGTALSRGLRRGVVVNIDQTVAGIKKAVEDAELMAGIRAESVVAGISGGHIKGINSHGVIAIKSREVTPLDVTRVIDAARAVPIPLDREVIHIEPQEFIVDDQEGIKEPIGMAGVRLEAKVHIVTGAVSAAQNIVRCTHRSGLKVSELVLQQMGSAEAVLLPDERAGRCRCRYWRRNNRHRRVCRRCDPTHLRDLRRRRPVDQRYSRGPTNSHGRG